MNAAIREMTFKREPTQTIRRQARLLGMRTLLEDGISKALTGITTLEEVLSTCHHEWRSGLSDGRSQAVLRGGLLWLAVVQAQNSRATASQLQPLALLSLSPKGEEGRKRRRPLGLRREKKRKQGVFSEFVLSHRSFRFFSPT